MERGEGKGDGRISNMSLWERDMSILCQLKFIEVMFIQESLILHLIHILGLCGILYLLLGREFIHLCFESISEPKDS